MATWFDEEFCPGNVKGGHPRAVVADIPGVVMSVNVAPGDSTDPESDIVLLEAMKMEIPVRASFSGRVSGIEVRCGDAVQPGDVIAVVTCCGEVA